MIHGCGNRGREYGLCEVRVCEKLSPGSAKTWISRVYIPAPEVMGFREKSASGASSLPMLGVL